MFFAARCAVRLLAGPVNVCGAPEQVRAGDPDPLQDLLDPPSLRGSLAGEGRRACGLLGMA